MRRRLALVGVAVTALIVISFVVPLGILARRQAEDRALSVAERSAQSIATALAVTSSFTESVIDAATARAVLDAFGMPDGAGIYLADGRHVGDGPPSDRNVDIARLGSAFTIRTPQGAAVLVPVLTGRSTTVVRMAVSTGDLTAGVASAWLVLALLGALLIGVAALAADRLGRFVVDPVARLRAAAARLAEGDITTRVEPAGPPEVVEVGKAFNELAHRLGDLLQAEREAAADLSHGLRTPLTALRLQVEALSEGPERAGLLEDVAQVQAAVDRVILDARSRTADALRRADLAAIARQRASFWEQLALEQDRPFMTRIPTGAITVHAGRDDVVTVVDTLIENVFSHTEPGSAVLVAVSPDRSLRVEDGGPGFDPEAAQRGRSQAGSTGLGLAIVERIARHSGGELAVGRSELGGAAVHVAFGAVPD